MPILLVTNLDLIRLVLTRDMFVEENSILLERISLTHMEYLTCREMFGNGVRTGTQINIIMSPPIKIRLDRKMEYIKSLEAGHG